MTSSCIIGVYQQANTMGHPDTSRKSYRGRGQQGEGAAGGGASRGRGQQGEGPAGGRTGSPTSCVS